MVSSSKYEIQQSPPFWWWQPLDDGVNLNSWSLNKLPLSICLIHRNSWIQKSKQHVIINLCITCHVINILLPLCHQQKGEVPQSSVCDVSFNSLHEKHNIKFYHHAVLKLENLVSVTSCKLSSFFFYHFTTCIIT